MKKLISHWRACGISLIISGLFPLLCYSQEKSVVLVPESKKVGNIKNLPGKIIAESELAIQIEAPKIDVDAIKKSAADGDAAATRHLALLYLNGENGIAENFEKAHELLLTAAKLGDEYAKTLCLTLEEKVLAQKAASDFGKWLKKAEQGDVLAQKAVAFAYRNGVGVDKNEKEFFKWINAAANQGDAYAQYKLGDAYFEGIGTEKNLGESFLWYEKSAGGGLSLAHGMAGNAYRLGNGVSVDLKKAFSYYEKGAQLGDPRSQFSLGVMYLNGEIVEPDYEKAISLFERAGVQNYANAYANIAYIYYNIFKDEERAFPYYKKAIVMGSQEALETYTNILAQKELNKALVQKIADLTALASEDNADAMLELAGFKEKGIGTAKDIEGALALYEKLMFKNNADAFYRVGLIFVNTNEQIGVAHIKRAAELGNGDAANYLGEYFFKKSDTDASFRYFKMGAELGDSNSMYNCFVILCSDNTKIAEALKYLNMAAEKSQPSACYVLGDFYRQGFFGFKSDSEKALLYLSKGATAGNEDAMLALSELFQSGQLGEPDKEQAFYWADQAAKKQNITGVYKVGIFLLNGFGVQSNPELGFKLIKNCADNNLSEAAVSVGDCYYFGVGTEKNEKEAYLSWKKALDLGNHNARYRIIVANQNGVYIPKDLNKAVALTRELAEENDSTAQYELAVYLEEEEDFRDEVESLAWFIVAQKNGEKRAPERLKKLKERMTPENIASAEARSVEIIKNL